MTSPSFSAKRTKSRTAPDRKDGFGALKVWRFAPETVWRAVASHQGVGIPRSLCAKRKCCRYFSSESPFANIPAYSSTCSLVAGNCGLSGQKDAVKLPQARIPETVLRQDFSWVCNMRRKLDSFSNARLSPMLSPSACKAAWMPATSP